MIRVLQYCVTTTPSRVFQKPSDARKRTPVSRLQAAPFLPIGNSYTSFPPPTEPPTAHRRIWRVNQSRCRNDDIPTPHALIEPSIIYILRHRTVREKNRSPLRCNMYRSIGPSGLRFCVYWRCPAPRPDLLHQIVISLSSSR